MFIRSHPVIIRDGALVYRLLNPLSFVAFKRGRRQGASSAYLNGYVTDEQRSRRPIFNATLWVVSNWPFFRVTRSLPIDLDMLVARALKNSQLAYGETQGIYERTRSSLVSR